MYYSCSAFCTWYRFKEKSMPSTLACILLIWLWPHMLEYFLRELLWGLIPYLVQWPYRLQKCLCASHLVEVKVPSWIGKYYCLTIWEQEINCWMRYFFYSMFSKHETQHCWVSLMEILHVLVTTCTVHLHKSSIWLSRCLLMEMKNICMNKDL